MARKAMVKEDWENLKLTREERLRLIDRIEKLDLGENDWLLVRVPDFGPAQVAKRVGSLIKEHWPEWQGNVLYLDEKIGLEALHWLARLTQSDIDTVLDELHKYWGK